MQLSIFRVELSLFSYPSISTYALGSSKEPYGSLEYPQLMFRLRNKKNSFQLHTFILNSALRICDDNHFTRVSSFDKNARSKFQCSCLVKIKLTEKVSKSANVCER